MFVKAGDWIPGESENRHHVVAPCVVVVLEFRVGAAVLASSMSNEFVRTEEGKKEERGREREKLA